MAKKKKTPAWQDSTYKKQISYYDKLKSDYDAEETRKKGDVGTYYGTLGVAGKKTPVTEKYWRQVKEKYQPKNKKGKPVGKPQYRYVTKETTRKVYDTKKTYTGTKTVTKKKWD